MAYIEFNPDTPVETQTGSSAITSMRENLRAVRDSVVIGTFKGWNFTNNGPDKSAPASCLKSRGTERIKTKIVYDDFTSTLPVKLTYSYSSDSGSSYATTGNQYVAYDASGTVVASNWEDVAGVNFNVSTPAVTQIASTAVGSARENLRALRDAGVTGTFKGWRFTRKGQPTVSNHYYYTKGSERIKLYTLYNNVTTWGTASAVQGLPGQINCHYYNSESSVIVLMQTVAFSYDASGYVSAITRTEHAQYSAYPYVEGPHDTETTVSAMGHARVNLNAIRDSVVVGFFTGWSFTNNGPDKASPASTLHSKSTERIKTEINYGSTGSDEDLPNRLTYSYSSDSGSNYATVGVQAIAYDASSNVSATSWS